MSGSLGTPSASTRRAVRQILGPHRLKLGLVAVSSFLVTTAEAIFLVIITRGLLAVADGSSSVSVLGDTQMSIERASLIAALVLAVRFSLSLLAVHWQSRLFQTMLVGLRRQLGDAYLGAPWTTQSKQPRGLVQHLVVQFPASIVSLAYQLVAALTGALGLLSLLVVAFVIDPITAVTLLGIVLALAGCLLPLRRAVKAQAAKALKQQTEFATRLSELADLNLEINVLGATGTARADLHHRIDIEATSQRRIGFFRDLINPLYTTLAYGAIVVAIVVLRQLGADDLPATGSVMLIMLRSLSYGQQMQHGASALAQMAPAAHELAAYLDEFSDRSPGRGSAFPTSFDTLALDDVTFGYSDERSVLENVDCTIEHGQIVGIVGASGAGKTTLVQLVLGLLEPTSGRVAVDGIDRHDIDPDAWTHLVSFVPQDTRLLDGTIADNIRFMRSGISDDAVRRAIEATGLDAGSFAEGIQTNIGVDGGLFSGGQRQRIAIARALATSPSLVVLDEPTSSLDAESELIVTDTIGRLRGGVTVIIVSHREAALASCDRRLRLESGRLTEIR